MAGYPTHLAKPADPTGSLPMGILALIDGGVSWTRRDTVVDAGPFQITADK